MQSIRLIAIEHDVPAPRWSQKAIGEHLSQNPRVKGRTAQFYQRFLADPGIENRHFSLDTLDDIYAETADQAIDRFQQTATQIGSGAVRKCLAASGLAPAQVDALIVTTCTGYLCPGLTSYIAQQIGLRPDIFSLDLTGIGCGAALPALRAGSQFLQSHPQSRALVVCVEVCSAAFSWGDEIDLILSNVIFADGAAACLMSNGLSQTGMALMDFESILWPEYRDDLRFRSREARLCNVINKSVPGIAAKAVKSLHDQLAARAKVPFRHYAVHPGGRRILDAIEEALELKPQQLLRSREVLRDYGNMSSPSILFVLKKILEEDRPQKGEPLAFFSFGAGFSAFGAVIEKAV